MAIGGKWLIYSFSLACLQLPFNQLKLAGNQHKGQDY